MNLTLLLLTLTTSGPISVSTEQEFTFPEHRAIELQADLEIPEGFELAKIQWRTRAIQVDLRPHDDGNTCSVWASPGTYEITLDAWLVNWEAKKFDSIEKIFNLTVQGSRPPPDNDDPDVPDPPDPPTSGAAYSVVIREASKLTADQTTALLEIRDFVDEANDESGNEDLNHHEFAPDAENPDGSANETVKKYVEKIPSGSKFPFGFVVQRDASGQSVIKWSGEIVESSDVIEVLERLVQ